MRQASAFVAQSITNACPMASASMHSAAISTVADVLTRASTILFARVSVSQVACFAQTVGVLVALTKHCSRGLSGSTTL